MSFSFYVFGDNEKELVTNAEKIIREYMGEDNDKVEFGAGVISSRLEVVPTEISFHVDPKDPKKRFRGLVRWDL